MTSKNEQYGYPLNDADPYLGRTYHLSVATEPEMPDFQGPPAAIPDFCVSVYYNTDAGATVEIARIDTAHGTVHFDRLYLPDQPKDDSVSFTVIGAEERLEANWRQYARQFERNHRAP